MISEVVFGELSGAGDGEFCSVVAWVSFWQLCIQAMVRSITQRCFPRLFCGFDATSAMWARMPRLRRLNTDGSVVVGLVGVELERAAAGPGPTPLIGATLSRTSSTSMLSYRFAPESSMWSGRPSAAVRM